jgi:hypothetical protein
MSWRHLSGTNGRNADQPKLLVLEYPVFVVENQWTDNKTAKRK